MSAIQIDGEHLDFVQLYRVVFESAKVELAAPARDASIRSRACGASSTGVPSKTTR